MGVVAASLLVVSLGCSEARSSSAHAAEGVGELAAEQTTIASKGGPTVAAKAVEAEGMEAAEPMHPYDCTMPALPISRPKECEAGKPYPYCKWKLPVDSDARGLWRRWRNTIVEHTYGRPLLVGRAITAAREFHALHPAQPLLIGDLDAPGPRHVTHKEGVDVDFYLPGALLRDNAGGGRYEANYEGKSAAQVEVLRGRVEELARILAACSDGKLRIYYNDDVVRERFQKWYDERGYETPFVRPMQHHNALHDFHLHVTFADDLEPLPSEPYEGPPPIEPILELPDEGQVAASDALSSRTRRATMDPEAGAPSKASSASKMPPVQSTPTKHGVPDAAAGGSLSQKAAGAGAATHAATSENGRDG